MIDLFTGASTAPDCDGVLAEADAVRFRTPYQSDPMMRSKINDGTTLYADYHLSESGMYVEEGFFGTMNVAIVEAVRITEDGALVPVVVCGAIMWEYFGMRPRRSLSR